MVDAQPGQGVKRKTPPPRQRARPNSRKRQEARTTKALEKRQDASHELMMHYCLKYHEAHHQQYIKHLERVAAGDTSVTRVRLVPSSVDVAETISREAPETFRVAVLDTVRPKSESQRDQIRAAKALLAHSVRRWSKIPDLTTMGRPGRQPMLSLEQTAVLADIWKDANRVLSSIGAGVGTRRRPGEGPDRIR